MSIKKQFPVPHAKLYIVSQEDEGLFGEGRWVLLRTVHECGSLQKAAFKLQRGYRKVWEDIKRTEAGFGRQLVVKSHGGVQGGSTRLTAFGLQLLKQWERYQNDVNRHMEKSYEKYLKKLIEDSEPRSDGEAH